MAEDTRLEKLPESWSKALAVVAHPDDLEFGASSAIARWTSQGKDVTYLLVTRGEAGIESLSPEETARIRENEEIRSARVVGVNTVEFLDYKDGCIEYGLPLRKDISRAIRKHQPDVLLTGNYHATWNGETLNMADHRWLGLAVLDASRDAGNRWIFPELLEEGLEPWSEVRMILVSHSPNATHGVDVTDFIETGIASLNEHKVYLENLSGSFDTETYLRWGASEVGSKLDCELAVPFEMLKL